MKSVAKSELFRELPSVDELIRTPAATHLVDAHGAAAVTDAARSVLSRLRQEISSGLLDEQALRLALGGVTGAIESQLRQSLRHSLRTVINATGVILHTNLGRAPLAEAALQHVRETAGRYSNLEFNVETGERGKRDVHVDRLFQKLLSDGFQQHVATAASAVPQERSSGEPQYVSTIVVNNNAAAVLLALNTVAEGGEVIVSRGELVEIGGSFRIPDVMAKSGAVLKEVGTTNRTRIADYESAISDRTKLLLRVHRSNFQIVGFTEQPSLAELAALGRKHNIPVVEDLGSGELFDLREVGVHGEPMISESLRAGVAVVTYSGDKLLGGPQAGLISGDGELVAKIRKNPLFRALRVDKIFYAALEATLLAYLREDFDAIPTLRMMRVNAEDLQHRAEHIVRHLRMSSPQVEIEVAETRSAIGGGSAPGATLPSWAVTVKIAGQSAEKILERLRKCETPIVARVEDGRVLLDLRTVEAEQDGLITAAVESLCEGGNAGPSSG